MAMASTTGLLHLDRELKLPLVGWAMAGQWPGDGWAMAGGWLGDGRAMAG